MELFFQSSALVLLAVILSLTLSSQSKSAALLLSMGAIVLVLLPGMGILKTLLEFLESVRKLAGLNVQMVEIMLKCAGISLICEVTNLICADSGNASLGKSLQILGSCIILWLSIPVFQELLTLVQELLEAL